MMPFMMELRKSIASSKGKWKKRLHTKSKDATPVPVTLVQPGGHASSMPAHIPTDDRPSILCPGDTVNPVPDKDISAWSVVKTMLVALEASADFIGPLKVTIVGLRKCIEVYEVWTLVPHSCLWLILEKRASDERKEYDELRTKLEEILQDLTTHLNNPNGLTMTGSVKRIYRSVGPTRFLTRK
ncbi:unnamed protein product [Rhizoctonia solani]|uniref:Uncharacterized protein n=1 Tax=Rhizoctonia solani TaxID=456999 RepID=A0A8H3BW78_9AGAM|nr:unnamed protein product [Rhizoctonia solani]